MILNTKGKIVVERWEWLAQQYDFVRLDEFIIMPNHFHGIIWIDRAVGNGRDRSLQKIKPISELIGAFKTTSSKRIHRETNRADFAWQKSFHDRIIRDDEELDRIREYIWQNPENWEKDENNFSAKN